MQSYDEIYYLIMNIIINKIHSSQFKPYFSDVLQQFNRKIYLQLLEL